MGDSQNLAGMFSQLCSPFVRFSEDCGDAPHQNCAAIVGSERCVKNNVQLLGLRSPDIVRAAVFKELRGALEQWSGVELVPTQVRGF